MPVYSEKVVSVIKIEYHVLILIVKQPDCMPILHLFLYKKPHMPILHLFLYKKP